MNFDVLRTFIAVAEKGSISQAARELYLTQPAVSRQIQSLEEEWEVRLLERQGREVQLTEKGEIFYRYARQIVNLLENLSEELRGDSTEVEGELRIGASTVPGQYILPSLIGGFIKLYPRVKVGLEIGDTQSVVERLLDKKVHLAVVGARVTDWRLESIFWTWDEIALVVPRRHPLSSREEVSWEEIAEEPLVWREKGSGTRAVLEERLTAAGVDLRRLRIAVEMGSTEGVVAAVEEGVGLGFVSLWALRRAKEEGKIVPLRLAGVDLRRELFILCRRQGGSRRAARAFQEYLEEARALCVISG